MTTDIRLNRSEKLVLGVVAFVALGLWGGLLALPWIALNFDVFRLGRQDDVERVKSVLGQLGTYGDLFGMLNCLFSGFTFCSVIYAVILQQREIHQQHSVAEHESRSVVLQTRLAAYQHLAEHHRDVGRGAGQDILLAARSKGRATAYSELISGVVSELESVARGEPTSPQPTIQLHDHPARIVNLRQSYANEARDVNFLPYDFAPIECILLDLVEEVAALTVLNPGNEFAAVALLNCGTSINAAIDPASSLEFGELNDGQTIDQYRAEQADLAFGYAITSLEELGVSMT